MFVPPISTPWFGLRTVWPRLPLLQVVSLLPKPALAPRVRSRWSGPVLPPRRQVLPSSRRFLLPEHQQPSLHLEVTDTGVVDWSILFRQMAHTAHSLLGGAAVATRYGLPCILSLPALLPRGPVQPELLLQRLLHLLAPRLLALPAIAQRLSNQHLNLLQRLLHLLAPRLLALPAMAQWLNKHRHSFRPQLLRLLLHRYNNHIQQQPLHLLPPSGMV